MSTSPGRMLTNIEVLRQCRDHERLLSHLSDEELEDIAYLTLYDLRISLLDRVCDLPTALFITKSTRTLYGVGHNFVVWDISRFDLPMKKLEGYENIRGKTQVEVLSSFELEKVVVRGTFGATLTVQGEVYLWGFLFGDPVVCFRRYESEYARGVFCTTCGKAVLADIVGGASISQCSSCKILEIIDMNNYLESRDDSALYCFVRFDQLVMDCFRCQQKCTSIRVGVYDLNYCQPCDLLQEARLYKVHLKSTKVIDIACGSTFMVIHTASTIDCMSPCTQHSLLLYGYFGGQMNKAVELNRDNIAIKMISCGIGHIAVMSNEGKLYICDEDSFGQSGYKWVPHMGHTILNEVPLLGDVSNVTSQVPVVVKICSGSIQTSCLMSDGSIYCFEEGGNVSKPAMTEESHKFSDIAMFYGEEYLSAKTESKQIYLWDLWSNDPPDLHDDLSECWQPFAEYRYSFTYESGSSAKEYLSDQSVPSSGPQE